jgi:aldehyde dehydrogenase (NAD+)
LNLEQETSAILDRLGVSPTGSSTSCLAVHSPITGELIATLPQDNESAANAAVERAYTAFRQWRLVPAPRRGELIRALAEELRREKATLGRLVTIEVGKTLAEGLGEVQEMIDICDFAIGLSRQVGGLTLPSERYDHRMLEQWHPMGVTAVITAFNFPVAVWCWNAALALVCGNGLIWKPSEKTPLTALAVHSLFQRAARASSLEVPDCLATVLIGDKALGEVLVNHPKVALVSATGSTRMGRYVAEQTAKRFARSILELGGNNAAIVTPAADLDLTLRAVAFGAMGTAGQRCTTLRRLFVHASVYEQMVPRLISAYRTISVGNPLTSNALVGPLIDGPSFEKMRWVLLSARANGGTVHGGERLDTGNSQAFYVRPALVEMPEQLGCMLEETFAPILYVMRYEALEEAIELQNAVSHGLSSSIFSVDIREVEHFLAAAGSDCGIANVNMGTSGAEIGGAFGGEKETGGGRESGSDSWKGYMRRQTSAINYGRDLPLAQGVTFEISE